MFDYSVRFSAIDKISAKIEKINAKMNGLKDKANQTKQTIKNSLGRMTLSSEFKLKTQKALQKLRTVRNRIRELKTEIRDFGLKAGAGGASLLYGIGKAVNSARLYELAFKDVKKAVDGTPEQLQELRAKMKAFKGASFEELSSITAEAGKMGFNAKKVMGFTEAVIKGAKALDFNGELAVGQIGKILAMTNQMNRAVEAGQDIMDKVTNLENKMAGVKASGVIDVWKRNADLYAQLNFKNDSMGAMSAFLEQSYVSSELGASGFKIMINKFKALESEFGFYSRIKEKGLAGIKDVMAEIAKMTPEQRIKKFGSEAMNLIDKLSNKKNLAKLDMALTISKNSKGAVEKEWQLFRATFDESLNDMNKAMANMGDSLGALFVPVIRKVASGLSVLSNKMSKFVKENPKLAKVIAYTTAVLGALGVVAGIVAVAMWAVSLPVLAIIGAVALLVAGLVSLYVYWEDITAYMQGVVKSAFEMIDDAINTVIETLSEAGQWIKDTIAYLMQFAPIRILMLGIVSVFVLLREAFYLTYDVVAYLLNKFIEFGSWLGTGLLEYINMAWIKLEEFGNWISSIFTEAINGVISVFAWLGSGIDAVINAIGRMWQGFTDFVGSLNIVENAINGVKSYFEMLVAPIKYVIDLIDSFLSKFEIYNKMKAKIGGAVNVVKEKVSGVVSSVKDKASYVSGKISSGWEATKNFFGYGDKKPTKEQTDSWRAVEDVNSGFSNKTVVEVKVTAENGAKAETKARSTGGVHLRNLSNGI